MRTSALERGPLHSPLGLAAGLAFAQVVSAAPAWVPSDESGLLIWYDAESAPSHSLYQESTGSPPGTTLADTDGETIGTWRDKSASGHHVTQSIVGSRPAYSSTALGGKPCAVFDGSSDYMNRTTSSVTASAFTIGIAWQLTSIPGAGLYVGVGGIYFSAGTCELLVMNGVGGYKNLTVNCGTGAAVGFDLAVDTNAHYMVATYNGLGVVTPANWQIWVDGTARTVLGSGLVIPGNAHGIGARPSGSNQMTGRFGAMVGYNSVKGSGPIASLNSWLAGVVS